MNRLSAATLQNFSEVRVPAFDRSKVSNGILHIGIGNFHRAHQAVYTDDILEQDPSWGIVGASLFSTTTRDRLKPQDFLYSVSERSSDGSSYRIIGAVKEVLCLADQREQLIATFCSPDLKLISLTVTEKGYCHTGDGELDENHPDIQHDLANPSLCKSLPGVLVVGLRARMRAKGGPLTIMSCDNLSGNGKVAQRVVLSLAKLIDPDLANWCENNVSFPETMVDRIVPQPTSEDRESFSQANGIDDEGLIVCEPFRQWVIEDNFASDRPPWEMAGAQIVSDVSQYEMVKLRMLNATHSALAYLGLLSGYAYIHETMADATLAGFAEYFLTKEVMPLINAPDGMDLNGYKQSILDRFANTAIAYGTAQVATDGSMKLPQRIFPTVKTALERSGSTAGLSLVTAAWLKCMQDPQLAAQFNDPASGSDSLLSTAGATDPVAKLAEASYERIVDSDIRSVISEVIAGQ